MSSTPPAIDPNLGQRARKATQKATNNPELDSLRRAPKAATCVTDIEDDPQPALPKCKDPSKKRRIPMTDSESSEEEDLISMSKAISRVKCSRVVENNDGDDREGLASDEDEGKDRGGLVEELSLEEQLGESMSSLYLFPGKISYPNRERLTNTELIHIRIF